MLVTPDLIHALPKTDLHCHLDGSIRLSTLLDLAKQQGVSLPSHDPEALFQLVYAGPRCASLVEYLKAFDITLSVLQTEEALTRVAYELAEDCAKENVWYLEVRYAPMLHLEQGLSLDAVVLAVQKGLAQAEKAFGMVSRTILCGIRHLDPSQSLAMAKLCVQYRHQGIVAFDLAGAELGFPVTGHLDAFRHVHQNYLSCTIHAGEADGPSSVGMALYEGGAHRIGHGVRIGEDKELLQHILDHQIPLEMCPSSNVQTKAAPSWKDHPLPTYLKLGCKVTVNTDNRLVTNTTLSQELWLCHTELGLSWNELKQLCLHGFESAFLPHAEKQALLSRFHQACSRL